MKSIERRQAILKMLSDTENPIPGSQLAAEFEVSRQVIVQDIALLRAEQHQIEATNAGYVLEKRRPSRVFKIIHTPEETETELNLVVDNGGSVDDVFVYHKVYGTIRADMSIASRRDVKSFLADLSTGKSSLLMNVTSGYHYHTISAPDEETLDLIQKQLEEEGFLAPLQEYEPVNFWREENGA